VIASYIDLAVSLLHFFFFSRLQVAVCVVHYSHARLINWLLARVYFGGVSIDTGEVEDMERGKAGRKVSLWFRRRR
jgi:hypothetical protein